MVQTGESNQTNRRTLPNVLSPSFAIDNYHEWQEYNEKSSHEYDINGRKPQVYQSPEDSKPQKRLTLTYLFLKWILKWFATSWNSHMLSITQPTVPYSEYGANFEYGPASLNKAQPFWVWHSLSNFDPAFLNILIHSVSKEMQLFFINFSWSPGSGSCDPGSWEICI